MSSPYMKIIDADTQLGSPLRRSLEGFRPQWKFVVYDNVQGQSVLVDWFRAILANETAIQVYVVDEGIWSDYEPHFSDSVLARVDWKDGFSAIFDITSYSVAVELFSWCIAHGWYFMGWLGTVTFEVNHDRIVRVAGLEEGELKNGLGEVSYQLIQENRTGSSL